MYCKYCGKHVQDDAKCCDACDKKLKTNRNYCIVSTVFTYISANYSILSCAVITMLLIVGAGISGMWGDGTMASIIDATPEFFILVCLGALFTILAVVFSAINLSTYKKLTAKQIPPAKWIIILGIANLCASIEAILLNIVTLLMCF